MSDAVTLLTDDAPVVTPDAVVPPVVETPAAAVVPDPNAAPADPNAAPAVVEDDKNKAPEGAPETYADFTMPEGVELKGEVLDELKALAKELNLPQDAAQKFVDLGAKQAKNFEANVENVAREAANKWAEDARADKEIGGDKLPAIAAAGKQVLDKFGTPELTGMLRSTGLGNHPEVLRFFSNVRKSLSDDTFVAATDRSAPATTNFYDHPTSNAKG